MEPCHCFVICVAFLLKKKKDLKRIYLSKKQYSHIVQFFKLRHTVKTL